MALKIVKPPLTTEQKLIRFLKLLEKLIPPPPNVHHVVYIDGMQLLVNVRIQEAFMDSVVDPRWLDDPETVANNIRQQLHAKRKKYLAEMTNLG